MLRIRKGHAKVFGFAMLVLVVALACAPETGPPPEVSDLNSRIEASMARGKELEESFRAMSVADLATSLRTESEAGAEPFNSRAYAEALRRGPEVVADLLGTIQTSEPDQMLALLAVRKLDEQSYASLPAEQRVTILVEALRGSRFFNTWGLPHLYWEDAARALVAEGKAAVPALSALLEDKRMAPVWGDEEVMEARAYQYRVCDYAWAMLQEIRGLDEPIAKDPAVRDQAMAQPPESAE